MKSDPDRFDDLQDRLQRLEKQNRRFKQVGVSALIIPVLLLVMAQAPSKKIVAANEIILNDDGGNVRAKLAVNATRLGGAPEMFFYDEKGKARLELDGGPGRSTDGGGSVIVFDGQGLVRGFFVATVSSGALLSMVEPASASSHVGEAVLGGGILTVSDEKGFSAALGVESLETPGTGETHKTSAASLVLFDKNKKVIWKTP